MTFHRFIYICSGITTDLQILRRLHSQHMGFHELGRTELEVQINHFLSAKNIKNTNKNFPLTSGKFLFKEYYSRILRA